MKYIVKVFVTLVFVFCTGLTAQKKAFEIEDLYKVKNIGSPVLSNNESMIAYSLTEYNLPESKSSTEIYLTDLTDGETHKLTNSTPNYSPIWNKDDSRLFFSSYRSGKEQLYALPLNGGEAIQITNFELGVSSPKVSADDNYIIFQAKVFPEVGINTEENIKIQQAMKNGPVQAHIADSLFVRHWTEYNDGQYNHIILYDIKNDKYRDLTPGFYHSPAFSAGGSDNYNFSPETDEVAFDSKRVTDPESSTNIDVWTVNLDGSGLKNITKDNLGADTHPKYSPDGKYIAYLTQLTPTYESERIMIALYNRETEENTVISEKFDNWVNDYEWSADSKSIYFTGHQTGYMPLFKIDVNTKEITEVIKNISLRGFAINKDETKAYYSYSFIHKPAEIAVSNLDNVEIKDITTFNKALTDSVDFRPGEQAWVEGANGEKCHVFIVKPHNFDSNKKYPLVINVHGGPQYQWMDSFRGDWQVYPGAGYVLAFPNPHGSTGYGQAYTAAISGDWDGKVLTDVMKVTDYLESLPYVDSDRMGAMGWSYGGYFMNLLQARTHRFKCLASMMGIYDLDEFWEETEELWFPNWDLKNDNYKKMSPSNGTDNFETPTLIISGERDYRIPYTQSLRYFTVLQQKNIDSRLIIFKNDGHWPSHLRSMPLYYNSHLEWFHKYLGGSKAPWDSKKLSRNLVF